LEAVPDEPGRRRLVRFPLDGSPVTHTLVTGYPDGARSIRWAPGFNRVSCVTGSVGSELWVMDGLAPKATSTNTPN